MHLTECAVARGGGEERRPIPRLPPSTPSSRRRRQSGGWVGREPVTQASNDADKGGDVLCFPQLDLSSVCVRSSNGGSAATKRPVPLAAIIERRVSSASALCHHVCIGRQCCYVGRQHVSSHKTDDWPRVRREKTTSVRAETTAGKKAAPSPGLLCRTGVGAVDVTLRLLRRAASRDNRPAQPADGWRRPRPSAHPGPSLAGFRRHLRCAACAPLSYTAHTHFNHRLHRPAFSSPARA
jgi:hypothetical protein